MNIGFVGLGLMGRPMAARLIAAGHRVLAYDIAPEAFHGWDIAPERAVALDDMNRCDLVILMLPNGNIVHNTIFGANGLAQTLKPDTLILDMSSSDPEGSKTRARKLADCNLRFVDAPVSGGTSGARAGTLTIMLGNGAALREDERKVLQELGHNIFDVGPAGAGHAVKALNNALSATSLLAMAEATETAKRFGIEPEVFVGVVNQSSGKSYSSEWKYPTFVLPGTFDSGFSLALMTKDIQTAATLSNDLGAKHVLINTSARLWETAKDSLNSNADHTEIATWVKTTP